MIISDHSWKNKFFSIIIRYFDYFILIFVFLFFTVMYNSYFKEYIIEIMSVHQERVNLEKRVYIEQSQYLNRLGEAKKNIDSFSGSDMNRIDEIVTNGEQRILLFYYLDNLIEDSGIKMTSVKFLSNERDVDIDELSEVLSVDMDKNRENHIKNSIKKLNIEMNVANVDYGKLKTLIRSIENNLRLIDIKSFNFSSFNEGGLKIYMTAYYN